MGMLNEKWKNAHCSSWIRFDNTHWWAKWFISNLAPMWEGSWSSEAVCRKLFETFCAANHNTLARQITMQHPQFPHGELAHLRLLLGASICTLAWTHPQEFQRPSEFILGKCCQAQSCDHISIWENYLYFIKQDSIFEVIEYGEPKP